MAKIAIIGQGYMGATHAAAWNNLGLGADIRYICTPRPGKPFADAPAADIVTDLAPILADSEVGIVSVCTPTPSHRDIALALLQAGKNVLLEKPMALTIADAREVAAAAATSSGKLMVAQVVRFFPGFMDLYQLCARGELGEITGGRAHRIGSRPTWAQWLLDDAQSGGPLLDLAIHDFDQMNRFLGWPVSVSTVGAGDLGPLLTTIEYASGAVGEVVTHWALPENTGFFTGITVMGTGGMADYEFNAAAADSVTDTEVARGVRVFTPGATDLVPVADADPYTQQAAYFLEQVASGGDFADCSLDSAMTALEVALAARISYRTGRAVPLEPTTG